MQIQGFQLELQGQREYARTEQEQLQMRIRRAEAAQSQAEQSSASARPDAAGPAPTYSADGQSAKETPFYIPPAPVMISAASQPLTEDGLQMSQDDRLRLEIINRLHQAMTGKSLGGIKVGADAPTDTGQKEQAALNLSRSEEAPSLENGGLTLELTRTFSASEQEATAFSAQGTILTADGRRISLDLELRMERSAETHQRLSATLGGRLQDPLVINFDGQSASLSNARYEFDLDADGQVEMIPGLSGNRAFIALDKNGDGQINDGSELFGAMTGDGFAELAAYDDDRNGFIDSGDAIFSQLKLWVPNSQGGQLYDLRSQDVGAIMVSGTPTEFSITPDFTENRLGVIRSTSIFLSESGGSGTVQHVDLSV
ncbi:hypothetical protein H9C73_10110 [Marinobacterium sp. AK62]|uniref:VCBS repeat-containing protein n=1 Tax=Marinobacterium alkalitolerans TaxID=1542925 RepID=A0ABS3ZBL8_9GAMM|nr:hypothetical protein [Marinobacterium alkalitolerans]MBP0049091.1 hypothetical protein [Marinobacterium alkalitolerans]